MVIFSINSFSRAIIHLYSDFISSLLNNTGANYSFYCLPTKKKKITLLKSPHVYKKSKEQFEKRNFKCIFFVSNNLNSNLLNYILINKPKSVSISLKKSN